MVTATKLSSLHITPLLQSRDGGLCRETVTDYTTAAKAGATFPSLIAYRITDRKFSGPALVAGFHRYAALVAAGIEEHPVDVRDGTFAEAWLAGWVSNLSNGMRYTNPDKRKAAETAIKLFRTDSAVQIAERLGVSDEFVRKVRKELVAAGVIAEPDKVIAKDGAPSGPTIKRVSEETPTVGVSSDTRENDDDRGDAWEPPEDVPVIESEFVGEPDSDPVDYITLDSLAALEREASDNHDHESAAEYQAEAYELRDLLQKHGGLVMRVPKTPPPLDNSFPQPRIDASKPSGKPPWMTGGNKVDPNHPFADLLHKFTALSAAVTKVLRSEQGAMLLDYLRTVSPHSQFPLLFFTFDTIDGDEVKEQKVKFVGLSAIRAIIRDVGEWKKARTKDKILKSFQDAIEAAKGDRE